MLIFNSKFPNYATEQYSDYVLIRFFPSEERMRFFLSGNLYMNPPHYYHNKMLGEGIYDMMEGAKLSVLGVGKKGMPKVEFGEIDGKICTTIKYLKPDEIPRDYKEPHFIYWPNGPKKQNILCLYSLWIDGKNRRFMDINRDMIRNFGDYGVVIANRIEFLNRIGKAVQQNSAINSSECGFVTYLTDEEVRGIVDWNPFKKRAAGYSYQNEFRVCIQKDSEGPYTLNLGASLEGIALPINTECFFNTLQFLDDNTIRFEDMT